MDLGSSGNIPGNRDIELSPLVQGKEEIAKKTVHSSRFEEISSYFSDKLASLGNLFSVKLISGNDKAFFLSHKAIAHKSIAASRYLKDWEPRGILESSLKFGMRCLWQPALRLWSLAATIAETTAEVVKAPFKILAGLGKAAALTTTHVWSEIKKDAVKESPLLLKITKIAFRILIQFPAEALLYMAVASVSPILSTVKTTLIGALFFIAGAEKVVRRDAKSATMFKEEDSTVGRAIDSIALIVPSWFSMVGVQVKKFTDNIKEVANAREFSTAYKTANIAFKILILLPIVAVPVLTFQTIRLLSGRTLGAAISWGLEKAGQKEKAKWIEDKWEQALLADTATAKLYNAMNDNYKSFEKRGPTTERLRLARQTLALHDYEQEVKKNQAAYEKAKTFCTHFGQFEEKVRRVRGRDQIAVMKKQVQTYADKALEEEQRTYDQLMVARKKLKSLCGIMGSEDSVRNSRSSLKREKRKLVIDQGSNENDIEGLKNRLEREDKELEKEHLKKLAQIMKQQGEFEVALERLEKPKISEEWPSQVQIASVRAEKPDDLQNLLKQRQAITDGLKTYNFQFLKSKIRKENATDNAEQIENILSRFVSSFERTLKSYYRVENQILKERGQPEVPEEDLSAKIKEEVELFEESMHEGLQLNYPFLF